MKTIFRIIPVLVAVLCGVVESFAGEPVRQHGSCIPVKSLTEDKLAYGPGETLDYVMHYKWKSINADVAKAKVKLDTVTLNGQKAFHANIFGRTAKFYDIFFKVREGFDSWFTRDGIVPLKFSRDSREGGYHSYNNYTYVWNDADPHIVADLETSRKAPWTEIIPLDHCTFDLPALFYMARNMNFSKVKPNVKYPMTFAIDNDVMDVYFIWLGREKKYIKGVGTVKTMKFAAKLVAGEIFDGKSDMLIWISDDDNRIPVYFEAPIKVGRVSGRIEGWNNLKYPFDALIEE